MTRPLPVTLAGTMEDVQRLGSYSPKEAAFTAGGARTIDIDLGAVTFVDQLILGHTNAAENLSLNVSYGVAGYTEAAASALQAAPANSVTVPRHMLLDAPGGFNARYIRVSGALPAGFYAGTIGVGAAIRPTGGHEWGGGRFVADTGSYTRLKSGGFGIDDGVAVGGWQWTLGDLSEVETDRLYALQLLVGSRRPIWVIEDPDRTRAGLNERMHYGLLTKLEAYERMDNAQTKWGMKVEDWA